MNSIARDLRSSLRILRNNPAFTFVVVCTLALGIGINTAMFTLLDALLLRALPYPNSARLVSLETKTPTGQIVNAASYPDFLDWKHARSFSMMAASSEQELIAAGAGRPERVFGELVSPDYFDLLGLHAIRGRVLTSAEAGGPSPVAVISENFWTRRFAHRGDIVGASVQINDQPITVVGVLPRGARGLSRHTDLWLPIGNIALVSTPQLLVNRAAFLVTVVGRLNPGADLRSAGADLQIVARNLQSSYPDTNRGRGVVAKSLAETRVASYREAVMILFAAGVFVMLIAAANVANLVLARSVSRQQEIAVRLALGASRSRLVRQILSENVVLAVLGASAGLLLASAALRFMRAFQTYGLDDASAVALNVPALLFTSAAALVVGILIGLFPAVHLSFASFQQNLKEGSRGITGGSVWSSRFRNLLVIFQSALATLLLVACGLMFRTLLHLSEINPGFRTQNVIAMQLAALPPSKYPEPVQLTNYYWSLLRSVDSVPGVQAAGATMRLPLTGPTPTVPFTIQGRGGDSAGQPPLAFYSAVSPDYFDVLAVPLSGRAFTERDNAAAAPVVIVNRALARRFWPGRNPIGEHLRFFDGEPRWREVVGIINDLRTESLTETPAPAAYVPFAQIPSMFASILRSFPMSLALRANAGPAQLANALRQAVWNVDRDQVVLEIRPLASLVSSAYSSPALYAKLLSAFGAAALLLAAVGICGVVSYTMSQRTQEIGVRLALGATRGNVLARVLRHGFLLVVPGALLGLLGALALSKTISGLLFEVSPADPLTLLVAAVSLVAVGLCASWAPAMRATRVDPVAALRHL